MENLLLFLPLLAVVIVANFGERHRRSPYVIFRDTRANVLAGKALRYSSYGLLIAINVGLLGFAGLALLNQLVTMLMPEQVEPAALAADWWGVAIASLSTSFMAFLPLVPAVRRWLSRWLPLDPDSIVHTTALVLAVYQIGLSLGQMALIGDLENLLEAGLALTTWDLLLSAVPLLLFALGGVGLFIRRGGRSTLERLGLFRPTWKHWLAAAGVTILLLAFDFGTRLLWYEVDPAGHDLVAQVTENLFGNLASVGGAMALGLSAGISEELLFRGAVQPRLGLLLTTLLFAVGHLQYGLTVATLEIFVIGLVLGIMRIRTSTTIAIVVHASYNALGVLLGLG
jgi:membrane protease YdiL (CAAX protease family)